jgi:hypothetical protein
MQAIVSLVGLASLLMSSGCFASYWDGKLLEPDYPSQVASIDTWTTLSGAQLGIKVTIRAAGGQTETRSLITLVPSGPFDSVEVSPSSGPTILKIGCGMDEIVYTPPITGLDDPVAPFRILARDSRTGTTQDLGTVPLIFEWRARNILGWTLVPICLASDVTLFPIELLIWGLSWSWR